jgi:hypothetical protein
MDIKFIVKDSMMYPLSDWKKYLILGIILVFSSMADIFVATVAKNVTLTSLLMIIGFLVGILAYGYQVRIIRSSLAGVSELPEFNSWFEMFIDGIKVFIVSIGYFIPFFLIILSMALFSEMLLLAILYMIVIIPVLSMAIAHMVDNESKLSTAFKFGEIFNKIGSIGWLNLVVWYVVTGILLLIMSFLGFYVNMVISMDVSAIAGAVLLPLLIMPYLEIYFYRSIALVYMSDEKVTKEDNGISTS